MCHNFFIHSFVNRHLGWFHVLAIVNSAAMNNGIHVSFSTLASSGYMSRSGIAGLYGDFIPTPKTTGKRREKNSIRKEITI